MWRVLLVDDDKVTRKLIIEILKDKAQCVEAINGIDALEIYNESLQNKAPFDVMLLDILMPDIYGVEVYHIIRTRERTEGISSKERIPIVMITAFANMFRSHLDDGTSNAFIEKPITAEKIISAIQSVVPAKEIQ